MLIMMVQESWKFPAIVAIALFIVGSIGEPVNIRPETDVDTIPPMFSKAVITAPEADPTNWETMDFPVEINAYAFDPTKPPLNPDEIYPYDLANELHVLRSALGAAIQNLGLERVHFDPEFETLRRALAEKQEEFVSVRDARMDAMMEWDAISYIQGHRLLVDALAASGRMAPLDARPHLGKVSLEAESLEDITWLQSLPFIGTVQLRHGPEAAPQMKFAKHSMRYINVPLDGSDEGFQGKVAVMDDGIASHSLLEIGAAEHSWVSGGTGPHGTWVAGAVSQHHSDQLAPSPDAVVYDLQVAEYTSSAGKHLLQADALENALDYMRTPANDISLGVLSYGSPGGGGYDTYINHIDWYSHKYDLLVAVSAGNDRKTTGTPCTAYNDICVSAGNDRDNRDRTDDDAARFTNYGPSTDGRKKPDISAPGTTLKLTDSGGYNKMKIVSGTSFAAPIVAGMANNFHADSHGSVDPLQLKAILIEGASYQGPEPPTPGCTPSGCTPVPVSEGLWAKKLGWGYANMEDAANVYWGNPAPITRGITPDHTGTWTDTLYSQHFDAGDLISGTLVWHRISGSTSGSFLGLPDLNLHLVDPSGSPIETSESTVDNVEMIGVRAATTGTYRWVVHALSVPSGVSVIKVAFASNPNKHFGTTTCDLTGAWVNAEAGFPVDSWEYCQTAASPIAVGNPLVATGEDALQLAERWEYFWADLEQAPEGAPLCTPTTDPTVDNEPCVDTIAKQILLAACPEAAPDDFAAISTCITGEGNVYDLVCPPETPIEECVLAAAGLPIGLAFLVLGIALGIVDEGQRAVEECVESGPCEAVLAAVLECVNGGSVCNEIGQAIEDCQADGPCQRLMDLVDHCMAGDPPCDTDVRETLDEVMRMADEECDNANPYLDGFIAEAGPLWIGLFPQAGCYGKLNMEIWLDGQQIYPVSDVGGQADTACDKYLTTGGTGLTTGSIWFTYTPQSGCVGKLYVEVWNDDRQLYP